MKNARPFFLRENQEAFLTTKEAAAILGLSPRTLDRYRACTSEESGPAYYKFGGAVRYRTQDVVDWAAKRRVCERQSS